MNFSWIIVFILNLQIILSIRIEPTCGMRNSDYLSRIVGGQDTLPGEFPWLTSIQLRQSRGYRHLCGGALVATKWVLTAAHCVRDLEPKNISVVTGDFNLFRAEGFEQRRRIRRFVSRNFDIATFENDIILLELDRPVIFNNRTGLICIPNTSDIFEDVGLVAGWGRLHEDTINTDTPHHVNLPIINKTICDEPYKKIGFAGKLNKCQLCAGYLNGGKDACQGDSGGPLVCRNGDMHVICGIVSWGIGCARSAYPGVYTKVSCFSEWIKNVIKT